MQRLGLDYLDLYLIHTPNPLQFRDSFEKTNAETWKAMEEIYRSGRVRAIGVSNYLSHHLEATLKIADIAPAVNQIRLYPGFLQQETVDYCKEKNILLQAYSPFGTGSLLNAPELVLMAKKYNKTPAQVALRWSLQVRFLPFSKSINANRIKENSNIFDFILSNEDVNLLSYMKNYCGVGWHPDTMPF